MRAGVKPITHPHFELVVTNQSGVIVDHYPDRIQFGYFCPISRYWLAFRASEGWREIKCTGSDILPCIHEWLTKLGKVYRNGKVLSI